MTDRKKYFILNVVALLVCIIPPIAVTVKYFPLWISKGTKTTVSGLSVLLVLICIIPFFRHIKQLLSSPSAKTVWLILLVALWMLRLVIDQMIVISAVGFLSNLAGALFYAWRNKYAPAKPVEEVNGRGR